MTFGAPPSRRKARSCNSAQIRVEDFQTMNRTDFRLYPSAITKRRVRRHFPVSGWRTIGPSP